VAYTFMIYLVSALQILWSISSSY